MDLFKKIILASLLGAAWGAITASYLAGIYLRVIYAIFLLGTALSMLFKRASVDSTENLPDVALPLLKVGGFTIGFIASLLGSGGGILMVPFLHFLKVKMRYAVATSTLIGFPVAVVGALVYMVVGLIKLPSIPGTLGYIYGPALLATTMAGIIFTPLGVKLAISLPTYYLQRLFAAGLILVGLKILFF